MKLWKENKNDKQWELDNREIAKQFLKSKYAELDYLNYYGIGRALTSFICASDGLNSVWDWDEKKGSIDGSPDVLEIIKICREAMK